MFGLSRSALYAVLEREQQRRGDHSARMPGQRPIDGGELNRKIRTAP